MNTTRTEHGLVVEIPVSPRKGETVTTRWRVTRNRPIPSLQGHPSCIRWSGLENGNAVVPNEHDAYLLRCDKELSELNGTYTDYANLYYDIPSGLVYRGKPVGAITVSVCRHYCDDSHVMVYGPDTTNNGTEWLKQQVVDAILQAIRDNADWLRDRAIAQTLRAITDAVADLRDVVKHVEEQALQILVTAL